MRIPWKSKFFFSGFGLVTILFAMSAPVMWAAVLTGVPWKAKFFFAVLARFCLWLVYYPLCNVSPSNVGGGFDGGTLEGQIPFFWFWLTNYPLCNVSPSKVGGGFDGGTLEGQIRLFLVLACLLASLQCQPQ